MCQNKLHSSLTESMIQQIIRKGMPAASEALDAMRRIPRHLYAGTNAAEDAYGDYPLPIGCEQTISQPYMVALMTSKFEPLAGKKILEIGTGSGYQAAVLAECGAHVYTIERHEALFLRAKSLLDEHYQGRVSCFPGDGTMGLVSHAPFDGILVTAYARKTPEALKLQLSVGGRMVIPVGENAVQRLEIVERRSEKDFSVSAGIACRFVPLIEGGDIC